MSGKPAARIGDSVVKGKIVTGSPSVLIGDIAEGQADACPTCEPAVGAPVNPILGVKLLPAETDFALAAPAPFAFTRSYLSRDARIGVLGPGWSIPGAGLGLEISKAATTVIDAQGRRITFGPLAPGEARFSPSERLWIRRGGPVIPQLEALAPWTGRWAAVPEDARHDRDCIFIASGGGFHQFRDFGTLWRLVARFDRNGYRTTFNWAMLPNGQHAVPVRVIDSAGRHYGFAYGQFGSGADGDPGVRLTGIALLARTEAPNPRRGDEADWLVRYDYGDSGDLVAVRDRLGQVVREFQWQAHIMTGHGVPGGQVVHYTWDNPAPTGKVLRQSEADGLTRDYTYGADHTTVTDSLGRVDTYHFIGEGPDTRWSAHTRADGSHIAFAYDGFGRRVAERDALGRTTRSQLDHEGRLIAQTRPDGSRWQYRLTPETGDLLQVEGPEGFTLAFVRDARGNPLSVTSAGGAATHYAYDDPALPDRPTRITDAKGGVRTLQWNQLGQLVAHTDCSGHTHHFEYDSEGRLVAERNALNETTRYRYDHLGRLIARTDAAGHSTAYQYDRLGRLIALTRPDGSHESLAWDRANRLLAHTNAAGLTQRFQYDRAGRLVALINENGATTRFAYDMMDRIARETGFDGRIQHYTYDAAGALLTRTEAGLPGAPATRYEHDVLGRLVSRHLPATAHAAAITETFQWRADGQLAGFASPAATVRFGFDAAGRSAHETQAHADGWSYQLSQTFDPLGAPESITLGEAPTLHWLTYGAGHMHGVRIADTALDFTRDALHRETGRSLLGADGQVVLTESRDYTALGQLAATRTAPLAGAARDRRYQYGPLGLISAIEDSAVGAIAYTYDGAERLIGSTHGPHTHTYRFDAAGNRVDPAADPKRRPNAEEWARIVQERLHDPNFNPLEEYGIDAANPRCMDNRISALAGTRNRYDGAGNLIEQLRPDGTRLALGYDGAHRLVHLVRTDPDGQRTTATYTYDALSRRIAKSVTDPSGHTTTTRYGWEGERLVCEDNGTTRSTVFHTPGSFVPLLQVEAASDAADDEETGETRHLLSEVATLLGAHGLALPEALRPEPKSAHIRFFHTDHLGTPLQLIDTTGKIHWQASPDDWRAVRNQRGARQPIRFQGQWEDEESGLYYNRYRYYDPGMGRYVTQDPIGVKGGEHLYQYAKNDAVLAIDPQGLETYVCQRPLGGNPGAYAPPILNHTYVCVGSPSTTMTCGSTTASSGGVLENVLKGSKGVPTTATTDHYDPGACDKRWGEDKCIETCIENELALPNRPWYAVGPMGTDCQEYTSQVVSMCEKRCVRG